MSIAARYSLALVLVAFGIAQLAAALAGIVHVLGTVWVWVMIIGLASAGFAVPVAVGAFIGALYVWHWPWVVAAVFAAPRLVTVIPGYVAAALAKFRHG